MAGNDANTKFLLHCEGDRSGQDHDATIFGTPALDPTVYPSAGFYGSIDLDGTNDYITFADSTDWDFAGLTTESWTIHFYIKMRTHAGNDDFVTQYEDGSNLGYMRHIGGTGLDWTILGAGGTIIGISGGEINDSNWHHVAFVKKGGATATYAIYKDGVQVAYGTSASADSFAGVLAIGGLGGNHIDGNVANLVVQKSNVFNANPVVGLTDTITPPTTPSTADADTKLLMHFVGDVGEGNVQASRHIVELSAGVILDSNQATSVAFKDSLRFDSGNRFISLADSTDWDIIGNTAEDWTIDFWIKHTDHVGTETYVSQYQGSGDFWSFYHVHGSGLYFYVRVGSADAITSGYGGEITDINWHHIALIKKGAATPTFGVYKDGVQVIYFADNSAVTFAGSLFWGQSGGSANYFDGNFDEPRIQKANIFNANPVVGLTDTIVVPTAPYSVDTYRQRIFAII